MATKDVAEQGTRENWLVPSFPNNSEAIRITKCCLGVLTMARSFRRTLEKVDEPNPISSLAVSLGTKPEDVKEVIVEVLSPYFTHHDVLSNLAVEFLSGEAIRLLKMRSDAFAHNAFVWMLDQHRLAYQQCGTECFRVLGNWVENTVLANSDVWSIINLETNKEQLPLNDFQMEVARLIGGMVEGCLQPYLGQLLALRRLIAGGDSNKSMIQTMDLGTVVDELYRTAGNPDIFAPPPWHIRLSQWRNMAQHHRFRIENQLIVGYYGRPPVKRIEMTRQEMLRVGQRINLLVNAVSSATNIFIVDNREMFSKHANTGSISLREESRVLQLSSAICTQGFALVDLVLYESKVIAHIKDCRTEDILPNEHLTPCSSCFLYGVSFN